MVTNTNTIDFLIYGEKEQDDKYDVFLGYNITNQEEAYIKLTESNGVGVYHGLRFQLQYDKIENFNNLKAFYINREVIQSKHHEKDLTVKGKGEDICFIVNATFNNLYHCAFGSEHMWTSIFGNVVLEEQEKLTQGKCYEVKVKRSNRSDSEKRFYIAEIPKEIEPNQDFLNQFKKFMTNVKYDIHPEQKYERGSDSSTNKYSEATFLPQFSCSLNDIKTVPQPPQFRKTRQNKSDIKFMKEQIRNESLILGFSKGNEYYAWNRNFGVMPCTVRKTREGENPIDCCWYQATLRYNQVTPEKSSGCCVTDILKRLDLYQTRRENNNFIVEDTFILDKESVIETKTESLYEHIHLGKINLNDCYVDNAELFEKPHIFVLKSALYRLDNVHWKVEAAISTEKCVENVAQSVSDINILQHTAPLNDMVLYSNSRKLSSVSSQHPREEMNLMHSQPVKFCPMGIVCRIEHDHAVVFSEGNFVSSCELNNRCSLQIGDMISFEYRKHSLHLGCYNEVMVNTITMLRPSSEWRLGNRGIPQFIVLFKRDRRNTPYFIYQEKLGGVMVLKKNSVFGSVVAWMKSSSSYPLRGYVSFLFDESLEKYIWVLVEIEDECIDDHIAQDSLYLLHMLWDDEMIRDRVFSTDRKVFQQLEEKFELKQNSLSYSRAE